MIYYPAFVWRRGFNLHKVQILVGAETSGNIPDGKLWVWPVQPKPHSYMSNILPLFLPFNTR